MVTPAHRDSRRLPPPSLASFCTYMPTYLCAHTCVQCAHTHDWVCMAGTHMPTYLCAHTCVQCAHTHDRVCMAGTHMPTDLCAHTCVQCAHTHDRVCTAGTISKGSPPNPGPPPEGLSSRRGPSGQSWKQHCQHQMNTEGSASPQGVGAAHGDPLSSAPGEGGALRLTPILPSAAGTWREVSQGPHDRRGALRPHGGEASVGWGAQGRGIKAPAGGRCVHRASSQGPRVLGTHRQRNPGPGGRRL